MKPTIEDILNFVAEFSGKEDLHENSDIENELSVYGDDWDEMMRKFRDKFQVDMDSYLWYFHTREEGLSIGGLFFKPPNERVERIPVTPNDLLRMATKQKWDIVYPEHEQPKRRYDLIFGTIVLVVIVTLWVWYGLK